MDTSQIILSMNHFINAMHNDHQQLKYYRHKHYRYASSDLEIYIMTLSGFVLKSYS
jgi:hypothetical protein